MAIVHKTLWNEVKELVLEQYKSSPNLKGLIQSVIEECAQPLEDAAFSLQEFLDVRTAEGEWLDVIGKLVNLKRYGGETDTDFRERIITQAATNSAGTPDNVIANAATMSGDPEPQFLEEADCTFFVYTGPRPPMRPSSEYVEIGGREYDVVKIGDLIWTAENLDWAWPGLEFNPSLSFSDPAGYYYDNASSTRTIAGFKEGMIYNGAAVAALAASSGLLPDGWRVPTVDDFNALVAAAAESVPAGSMAYKAITLGTGWNGHYADGDNSLGFNWVHNGVKRWYYGYSWTDDSQLGLIGGIKNGTATSMYFFSNGTGTITTDQGNPDTMLCTIRLVKDAL